VPLCLQLADCSECNTLQHTATHCNTLHILFIVNCIACSTNPTHRNQLQQTATHATAAIYHRNLHLCTYMQMWIWIHMYTYVYIYIRIDAFNYGYMYLRIYSHTTRICESTEFIHILYECIHIPPDMCIEFIRISTDPFIYHTNLRIYLYTIWIYSYTYGYMYRIYL